MFPSKPILAAALTLCAAAGLHAQTSQSDAPAPNIAELLQALKAMKEQQIQVVKANKQRVLSAAQQAAVSPSASAAAWAEAIKQTQFEGAEKSGAQTRAWRDGDGSAFTDKEVQSASHLYFRWLVITMQRSLGTPTKDLLPAIIQYTKDVAADQAGIEAVVDRGQREKELANSKFHGKRREKGEDEEITRRVHNMILRGGLSGSAPVRALKGEDAVKVDRWEGSPGNVDGIFSTIILPELRLAKDIRVLEYWDMKIKKETEALKDKPTFDQEKFTKERRPSLLWSRAMEYQNVGMRNRALAELFQILRAYPQHPDMSNWIGQVEAILVPPAAAPEPGVPVPGTAPTAAAQ